MANSPLGMIWTCGANFLGQLGDNSTTDRSSPVCIARMGSYSKVAKGRLYFLAIDDSGMIWAWGYNGTGQLGDNSTVDKSSPVSICRPGSYVAISCGINHSLALDSEGVVWAWGYNFNGELGDNSRTNKSSPISIAKAGSFVAISAGYSYSMAIDDSGMIWAWGDNGIGQLGDNSTVNKSSPVSICRPGSYVAISCGFDHSLALDSEGVVWAWGYNVSGQLGDNSIVKRSSPVSICRPGSYIAISAGENFSLALDSSGNIWAWGNNQYGQLGDNSTVDKSSPVSICRPGSYIAIGTSGYSSYAIDSNGQVWAWGENGNGQLGDNSTVNKSSPVSIAVEGIHFFQVSSGLSYGIGNAAFIGYSSKPELIIETHPQSQSIKIGDTLNLSVAVSGGTGTVHYQWKCNGSNVGTDSSVYSKTNCKTWDSGQYYVIVSDDSTTITSNIANVQVLDPNSAYTWGLNSDGQLGNNSTINSISPVTVSGSRSYVQISEGYNFTLAIDSSGQVYAWGNGEYGQLGTGDGSSSLIPVSISDSRSFVEIAAGTGHALAIDSNGNILSWGLNTYGQLGVGDTDNRLSPTSVACSGSYVAVAAGNYHSLALDSNGNIWSWGLNDAYQLGNRTDGNSSSPILVGSYYVAIAAGGDNINSRGFSLAIDSNGNIWGWGANDYGQLTGTCNPVSSPTLIIPGSYKDIAAGDRHALAIDSNGNIWSWGNNTYGQLGDNSQTNSNSPVSLAGNRSYVAIAAGGYHSLALDADGIVYSWGLNDVGELGNGTTVSESSPVVIANSKFSRITAGYKNSGGLGTYSGGTAPIIDVHPASQAVPYGGTLNLSVEAHDSGTLHYLWTQNGNPVGTDSSIYQAIDFSDSSRGIYRVTVSNDYGSVSSNDATVTVKTTILTHPISRAFEIGSEASLDVTASGYGTLTYQWYKDSTSISGAINRILNLTPFADSSRGVYKVNVTGDGNTAVSNDATLTVQPKITVHPASQKFVIGSDGTLQVTVLGHSPITYQWYKDGTKISGATSNPYILYSFADSSVGIYRVVVTSDGNDATSNDATISIQPAIISAPSTKATQGTLYTYNPVISGMMPYYWTISGQPTGMTLDTTTGAISWVPGWDKTVVGPITLAAIGDSTVTQDWTIAVTMVAPKITSTPGKVASEGVLYTYLPTANVVNLDRWSLTGAPSDMTFTPSTGLIQWIPYDRTNSGLLTLTVHDKNTLTDSQDWTVAVSFTAPVITSTPDTTAYQNVIYYYQPTVLEPNVRNWTISGAPVNMIFDTASGGITWTPTCDQTGAGPITLTVYDLGGASATQTFSIIVLPRPRRIQNKYGKKENVGPYGRYGEEIIWELDSTNYLPVGFRRIIS